MVQKRGLPTTQVIVETRAQLNTTTDQCIIQTSYLPPTISLFNFASLDVEVHQEKGTEYQDMNADWTTPLEKMRHRAGDSNLIMMMMFVLTGGDLNNSVRLSVCD